jgi:ubiquinone biosynthesis protein COQ9
MAPPLPADPTLDEVRTALAPRLGREAAFDGWTEAAVASAARGLGIDPDMAQLAFPGGALDRIDAWFASIDAAMAEALPPDRLGPMKIREKIRALVEARIDIIAPDREGLRRAQAILAMPANLGAAAKLGWRAADVMWRLAGDTATDFNHYSKRALLGGIYAATMLIFVNDKSEGFAETRAFLGRRIDDVMRFEKAKAGFLARRESRPSLARFIGRLRYPAT